MRASTLMWLALTVAVGVSMFLLKYKVQALEDELVVKQEQIARDRDAVRVLEAEWAYFNDPERLRRLSAEHLDFIQPSPGHMKTMSALPFRKGLLSLPKDQKKETAPLMQPAAQNPARTRITAQQAAATATKHLTGGPMFFARIQRYLIPARADAQHKPGDTP